jgi:hypothetical protein
MVDVPRSAFSGSYDNDPSTSAGGSSGSDSNNSGSDDDDDVSVERQRENYAAATGQLDELAKERAGQGGTNTDLSEIDEQDRQQARKNARERDIARNIQNQQQPTGPSVGEVAQNVGRTLGQVGDVANEAADLATSGPLDVPKPGSSNQNQPEPEQNTSTLKGPFQGENLSPPEQAANQITRTFKRGARNPNAAATVISGVAGAPLARQSDAAQTARDAARAERQARQQLGIPDRRQRTQATLPGEAVPTLEGADTERQRRVSQDAIQATQAQALTTPQVEANEAIREDVTSGGFLTPQQQRDLQNISEQTDSAITTGTRVLGIGGRAFTAPGRAGAAVLGGNTSRAEDILQNPINVNRSTRQDIGTSLVEGDVESALETTADASTRNEVSGEIIGENVIRGPAQLANPARLTLLGETGAEAIQGTAANLPENPAQTAGTVGVLGAGVATAAADATVEQAQNNPRAFVGQLIGGSAASAALSPFRFTKTDIPLSETRQIDLDVSTQRVAEGIADDTPNVNVEIAEAAGETTVRGLRVTTPPVAEALGIARRGRTLVGARGLRPSLGAPSVASEAGNLDLARMGATGTATVEPGNAFEADIFRATASDLGGTAAARYRAAEGVQDVADNRPNLGFEADTAEEAVGQARAVPDEKVDEVTQALRDTDATVFGSAAARAQLDEFRQPRDLDVVVDDKAAAKERFAESLEGSNADVSDVFDIKATEDVPGRASGGETIKFGRTSRDPRELGGVPFNPVEEELVRKAGASAFLRSEGAAGTPDLDVGPEPRAAGRPDVRLKDAEDTVAIARGLGETGPEVRQFERAFGLADERSSGITTAGAAGTDQTDTLRFFDDERGQFNPDELLPRRRRTNMDADRARESVDSPTGDSRVDDTIRVDAPDSPSSVFRSPGESPAAPFGGSSAASPAGSSPGTPASPVGGSGGASGTGGGAVPSPSDSPNAGAGGGISIPGFGSPPAGSPPEDSSPPTFGSPPSVGGPPGIDIPAITGSPPSTGSPPPAGSPPSTTSPPETGGPSTSGTRARPSGGESDADENDWEPGLLGAKNPNFTDYYNPLSGELLETDPGRFGNSDSGGFEEL